MMKSHNYTPTTQYFISEMRRLGQAWKLQRRWEESKRDIREVKSPRFVNESARFLQRLTQQELCAYVLDNGLNEVVRFEGCTGVIDQYHPYVHVCFSPSPQPTTFLSSRKVYSSRWGDVVRRNHNHFAQNKLEDELTGWSSFKLYREANSSLHR